MPIKLQIYYLLYLSITGDQCCNGQCPPGHYPLADDVSPGTISASGLCPPGHYPQRGQCPPQWILSPQETTDIRYILTNQVLLSTSTLLKSKFLLFSNKVVVQTADFSLLCLRTSQLASGNEHTIQYKANGSNNIACKII